MMSDCMDLREFLSSLKFELEGWLPELERKGMGMRQLAALTEWEEGRLDRLFAKLVPEMPELLRYGLTEGVLKFGKIVKLGFYAHQESDN
jgi:hypothetical protein